MSQDDPIDTQSQEREQAEINSRQKHSRDTEESDFKWLFSSKRGRRIIWRQLDRAGVFRLSFNTNAMLMAFAEGNRNEGNRTIAMIHSLCPDLYHQMVREANDTRNIDD
jgi:hypothetical protein